MRRFWQANNGAVKRGFKKLNSLTSRGQVCENRLFFAIFQPAKKEKEKKLKKMQKIFQKGIYKMRFMW